MNNLKRTASFLTLALLLGATVATAATLHVRNNGVDSATCGGLAAPCRSINTAIDNASAGDKILVGPGRYSPDNEPAGACGGSCLIEIDKRLRIQSTHGPAVTVIDAGGDRHVVQVDADGVFFGLVQKGFTLTGATGGNDGLNANSSSDDVTVAGHRAIGNTQDGFDLESRPANVITDSIAYCNDGDGFEVDGGEALVRNTVSVRNNENYDLDNGPTADDSMTARENASLCSLDEGFDVNVSGPLTLTRNVSSASAADGFDISSSDATCTRDVAVGNRENGFNVDDSGNVFELVAALGNREAGFLTAYDVTINMSDLFGNIGGTGGNCGLENDSGAAITAPQIYWGATTGPGGDPADTTCGDTIDATSFSSSEFNQPFSWLPF